MTTVPRALDEQHGHGLPWGFAAVAAALTAAFAFSVIAVPGALSVLAPTAIALLSAWMFFSHRLAVILCVWFLWVALIDGWLRLRTGNSQLGVIRDILLVAIFGGVILRMMLARTQPRWPPLTALVLAWGAYVLAQILNPRNVSLAHSLVALRQDLLWVGLFFCGYALMTSWSALVRLSFLVGIAAAINSVVALVQFGLTPRQFADWGPGYAQRVLGTDSVSARAFVDNSGMVHIRPFGLGSDAGFAGQMALIALPCILAVVACPGIGRRRRGAALALLPFVLAGIATSQARVVVVAAALAALFFVILSTIFDRRRGPLVLGAVCSVAAATVAIAPLASSQGGAFDKYRTLTANPTHIAQFAYDYRKAQFSQLPGYITRYPLGAGLGSAGPAAAFAGRPEATTGLANESQAAFLVTELGIPGLILWTALVVAGIGTGLRALRHHADVRVRVLLSGVMAGVLAIVFSGWVGAISVAPPAAPYLWFAIGTMAAWRPGARLGP